MRQKRTKTEIEILTVTAMNVRGVLEVQSFCIKLDDSCPLGHLQHLSSAHLPSFTQIYEVAIASCIGFCQTEEHPELVKGDTGIVSPSRVHFSLQREFSVVKEVSQLDVKNKLGSIMNSKRFTLSSAALRLRRARASASSLSINNVSKSFCFSTRSMYLFQRNSYCAGVGISVISFNRLIKTRLI
jgi:hypothetical protein